MATVINNPGNGDGGGNGASGIVIGLVLAIVILAVIFLWVVPNMRGGSGGTSTGTMESVPQSNSAGDGGTTVEVPDEIDVNVKQ